MFLAFMVESIRVAAVGGSTMIEFKANEQGGRKHIGCAVLAVSLVVNLVVIAMYTGWS